MYLHHYQGCDVSSRISGQTKRTNPIWICIWFGDTKFAIFPEWYRIFVSVRTKRTNLIWFFIWFGDPKYLYRSQPWRDPMLLPSFPPSSFCFRPERLITSDDLIKINVRIGDHRGAPSSPSCYCCVVCRFRNVSSMFGLGARL